MESHDHKDEELARLRLANACREDPNPIIDLPRPGEDTRYEVLSLNGTVGAGGSHLHMCVGALLLHMRGPPPSPGDGQVSTILCAGG